MTVLREHCFAVRDYDLAATLTSGQAFRWVPRDGAWEGVIGQRWVRLRQTADDILAEWIEPAGRSEFQKPKTKNQNPDWLAHYLQTGVDLPAIVATFPDDAPMRTAVAACRGLRLLRQDPWECLSSFILSSTKQIVQIQQIVALLCERFGESLGVPEDHAPVFSFPAAARLAECAEQNLRDCKMGFRAPNLLRTAKMISAGEVDLDSLHNKSVEDARAELLRCPGVGEKIANCVLLFAYGFQSAFPVDVWVMKALQQLYFRRRRVSPKRLARFTTTHFGPNAGYAQQYLFHYIRKHQPHDGEVGLRR